MPIVSLRCIVAFLMNPENRTYATTDFSAVMNFTEILIWKQTKICCGKKSIKCTSTTVDQWLFLFPS